MVHWPLYLACLIGALGVWGILAAAGGGGRAAGAIVGLASLALGLTLVGQMVRLPGEAGPPLIFYGFASIAIASAVRMISHSRPVYSALYFVMVVLSSAAIFLLLEAEFMAFALIIVYAGAILITYLFVLMLAQQAPTSDEAGENTTPEYDRNPTEPFAGVFIGFLMLALLGQVIFSSPTSLPAAATPEDREAAIIAQLNELPHKRQTLIEAFRPGAPTLPIDSTIDDIREGSVVFKTPPSDDLFEITFAEAGLNAADVDAMLVENIEQVGWALVHQFPVSLELAGIILLMAMFGAVVLARKQIELGEDEKRVAAGMQPLAAEGPRAGVDS